MKGEKFGRWTVISESFLKQIGKQRKSYVKCQCLCGTIKDVSCYHLLTKASISCGCYRLEKVSTLKGLTKHPLYHVWWSMLRRCHNPSDKDYKIYGGRNIKVCDEWQSFENFLIWASKQSREKNFTLDRINNDKGYSSDNCRFTSWTAQAQNRRNNRKVNYCGNLLTIPQLASFPECIPCERTLRKRICDLHWSIKKAVLTPVRGK